MIIEPLTQEEQNQLDDTINYIGHEAMDTFKFIGSEKVSWGAMKNLLNKKEGPEIEYKDKWLNDEVVNYYCQNFLGKEDIKCCEHKPGRKCSHFFSHTFGMNCLVLRVMIHHCMGSTILKRLEGGI
jgi:hypothetical protein